MLKRLKTEKTKRSDTPSRVLVVDDHPDAARLVAKLLRRSGYEVATVGDDQVALQTLTTEQVPITAVVASFSAGGTSAALKLLDAIRHAPEAKVHQVRVVLIMDFGTHIAFAWQSGADAIVRRPYRGETLLEELAAAISRTGEERGAWRVKQLDEVRPGLGAGVGDDANQPAVQFN